MRIDVATLQGGVRGLLLSLAHNKLKDTASLKTLGKEPDIYVHTGGGDERPYRPGAVHPRVTDALSSIPIWDPGKPFNDLLRSRQEERKTDRQKDG